MRTSRWARAGALAAVILTGCDDRRPTAPSPPALASGPYLLTLDLNVGPDAERACSATTLSATSATVRVLVAAAAGRLDLQPDGAPDLGLRATLTLSDGGVAGTMRGEAQDQLSALRVQLADATLGGVTVAPAVLGRVESSRAASGSMTGSVRLWAGDRARQCPVATWRLEAQ